MGDLVKDLQAEHRENDGFISAIDGALATVRKKHAVLNSKLQGMGSIIAKRTNVICHDQLEHHGVHYGRDFAQMAMVHDEFQFETEPDHAEFDGETAVDAMKKAGECYGMNTPISGESKVGANWSECHQRGPTGSFEVLTNLPNVLFFLRFSPMSDGATNKSRCCKFISAGFFKKVIMGYHEEILSIAVVPKEAENPQKKCPKHSKDRRVICRDL